ncbi:MAG: chemotaxis protein CheW [Bacillota bacterium]|nr:chemotaxis protein CheW [Bacillota bacterium]
MSKVVVFRTGNEEYAIPLQLVVSIEKIGTVTPIPNMPDYVKGVIEIRQEIIPIIDLEFIFYQRFLEINENARLISIQTEQFPLGILVNEVKEIIEIPAENIKQVALISFADTAYISGIASIEGRLITLVNPEVLIDSLEGIKDLKEYMGSRR